MEKRTGSWHELRRALRRPAGPCGACHRTDVDAQCHGPLHYKAKTGPGIVTSSGNFLTPYDAAGAMKAGSSVPPGLTCSKLPSPSPKRQAGSEVTTPPRCWPGPWATVQTKSSGLELFAGILHGNLVQPPSRVKCLTTCRMPYCSYGNVCSGSSRRKKNS